MSRHKITFCITATRAEPRVAGDMHVAAGPQRVLDLQGAHVHRERGARRAREPRRARRTRRAQGGGDGACSVDGGGISGDGACSVDGGGRVRVIDGGGISGGGACSVDGGGHVRVVDDGDISGDGACSVDSGGNIRVVDGRSISGLGRRWRRGGTRGGGAEGEESEREGEGDAQAAPHGALLDVRLPQQVRRARATGTTTDFPHTLAPTRACVVSPSPLPPPHAPRTSFSCCVRPFGAFVEARARQTRARSLSSLSSLLPPPLSF